MGKEERWRKKQNYGHLRKREGLGEVLSKEEGQMIA